MSETGRVTSPRQHFRAHQDDVIPREPIKMVAFEPPAKTPVAHGDPSVAQQSLARRIKDSVFVDQTISIGPTALHCAGDTLIAAVPQEDKTVVVLYNYQEKVVSRISLEKEVKQIHLDGERLCLLAGTSVHFYSLRGEHLGVISSEFDKEKMLEQLKDRYETLPDLSNEKIHHFSIDGGDFFLHLRNGCCLSYSLEDYSYKKQFYTGSLSGRSTQVADDKMISIGRSGFVRRTYFKQAEPETFVSYLDSPKVGSEVCGWVPFNNRLYVCWYDGEEVWIRYYDLNGKLLPEAEQPPSRKVAKPEFARIKNIIEIKEMALSVTNSHLMIFPPGTPPLILALNNKHWIDSQDKRDLLAPMMARDTLTPVGRIVHADGKVLTIRKYDLEEEERPIRCAAIHLLKATGYGMQTLVGIGLTPLVLTVAAVALLVLGYPTVALIGFGEALLFLALTIGDFRSKQGLFATGKARCIHEFKLFREFWSLNAQRV